MRSCAAMPTSPCTARRTCPWCCQRAWASRHACREKIRATGSCFPARTIALTLSERVRAARTRPRSSARAACGASAQLAPLFGGATFAPIRGNVDTRLAKLDAGGFDALVLACAGLRRLGFGDRISAPIPVEQCVPAPGQGIVATEIRMDDEGARAALREIHDEAAGRALARRTRARRRARRRVPAAARRHRRANAMERSRCWRWWRRSTARAPCAVR